MFLILKVNYGVSRKFKAFPMLMSVKGIIHICCFLYLYTDFKKCIPFEKFIFHHFKFNVINNSVY